ncbi:MAG: VCBS repeat-containing protein, partial [Myxococcales bacterium]|nr:VCBS repeat-containing protein [Myxococcales bacterium]
MTTEPTDTLDTSTSGLPPGECEDGQPTPGELCLGDLTVLMANDTVLAARIGDVSGSPAADVVYLIPTQLVVRVGDGSGDFGGAVFDEAVDGGTFELHDFDGDGDLDVVAIEQNGPLRVLLGNGSGSFTPSDLDPVGNDPR